MWRITREVIGKLTKCIDRATDKPYKDWRIEFLDRPGLVVIRESEEKHPGKSYISIFPFVDNFDQEYMSTSPGDVEYSSDGCKIVTERSIYEYVFARCSEKDINKLVMFF